MRAPVTRSRLVPRLAQAASRSATPAGASASNVGGRSPILRLVSLAVVLCLLPLGALTYSAIHLADRAVVTEVKARMRTTTAVTATLVQQQMEAVAELTAAFA